MAHVKTLDDAVTAASILTAHSAVLSVELFGSVARTGVGNDLDLILVTDPRISTEFEEIFTKDSPTIQLICGASHSKGIRRYIVNMLLMTHRKPGDSTSWTPVSEAEFGSSLDIEYHASDTEDECPKGGIDLYMFPPTWRDELARIQTTLRFRDPNFMGSLAKAARRFDAARKIFLPA